MHTQHLIIVKVALFYCAAMYGNVTVKRGGQSINDATFHLGFDAIRMHGKTGIHYANCTMRPYLAIGNVNLDNLGNDGAE